VIERAGGVAKRTSRRAAASNFAGSMVLQSGLRLARLVSMVTAAYLLDTADFAALAIALALTDLARASLQAFDVAAVRAHAAAHQGELTMRALTGAKLLTAIVFGAGAVGVSLLVYGPLVASIVAIISIGTVPGSLASLWMVPTQVELRLLSMAPSVVVASVVTVGAATLGAVTGGPVGFATGLLVGEFVLFCLVSIRDRFAPDFHPAHLRPALSESPKLMIQQLGYAGQFRFGTLVLGLIATPLAVAEYSIASRLAEGLVIVSTAINATSYPLMAKAHATGDRDGVVARFVPSYWIAVGVSVSLVCLLVFTLPIWLTLLFPKYPGAAVPFALVGIAVTLFFASGQTAALLNALHRDSAAAGAATLGLGANVAGTLMLAGSFGAIGVAVARLAGEAARMAMETLVVARADPADTARAWVAWLAFGPLILGAALSVVSGWAVSVVLLSGIVGSVASAIAASVLWPRSERTEVTPI
jgi:O-antigen/teichoic acid export membrane protein